MHNPIRTAIVGYGRSGSTMHAGAIGRDSGFRLNALCDTSPHERQAASDRFGCSVYENHHEMLASEALDLVCIITRSDQHCQMACDCLQAGTNVLVTKPWATNADEGRLMIATAKASGKQLLPWLPARWGCILRRLRQLVQRRTVGQVFLIRRIVGGFGTRSDWQTRRAYGGGYLLNWGPHIVDPPVVLMQSPVDSVYGRLKQTINPGDAEDLFFAVLNLANGCLIQAEYTITTEPLPDWIIQGDRGTIVVKGNRLMVHQGTPTTPDDPTQYSTMAQVPSRTMQEHVPGSIYGNENEVYAAVAKALREEQPFPVATSDALQLSIVLDAIRESDRLNEIVKIRQVEGCYTATL